MVDDGEVAAQRLDDRQASIEDDARHVIDGASLGEGRRDFEELRRAQRDAFGYRVRLRQIFVRGAELLRQRFHSPRVVREVGIRRLEVVRAPVGKAARVSQRDRGGADGQRDYEKDSAVEPLLGMRQLDGADGRKKAEIDRGDGQRAREQPRSDAAIPGGQRHRRGEW